MMTHLTNWTNWLSPSRLAVTGSLLLVTTTLADPAPTDRETFTSPDQALAALRSLAAGGDIAAMPRIFGPLAGKLASGDAVEDRNDMTDFARRLVAVAELTPESEDLVILHIGIERHPFPVPIVRADQRWYFDTEEGIEEIIDRRIGENELNAIAVCRGAVVAELEYFLNDHDGDQVLEYAQRISSTSGKRDGLYWRTALDEPASPLGPLVADARAAGYTAAGTNASGPRPYHGYLYKLLHRQGAAAPGGAYDYRINGNMVAGFAMVAYPIEWAESGIMTFLVNANGVVMQKNLGPETTKLAAAMESYDVDPSWQPAVDNE